MQLRYHFQRNLAKTKSMLKPVPRYRNLSLDLESARALLVSISS